jgi:hypothetical protein
MSSDSSFANAPLGTPPPILTLKLADTRTSPSVLPLSAKATVQHSGSHASLRSHRCFPWSRECLLGCQCRERNGPVDPHDGLGKTHEVYCGVEKQESGYIELSNRVKMHYFYWYFGSRNEPSTDPLILWLPGGPGEGGECGLLAENGPRTVSDDLSTTINAYSWNTNANVLWIDIPTNSGFSYSTTAEDDEFTEESVDDSVSSRASRSTRGFRATSCTLTARAWAGTTFRSWRTTSGSGNARPCSRRGARTPSWPTSRASPSATASLTQ